CAAPGRGGVRPAACAAMGAELSVPLAPLCHGHINMLGHYSFTLAELVTKGHLRPLKEASEAENVA
ncbi:hypothetical protein, partial [Escherichia coli]|uniref:hypothetical protein n=1 Tax=Escherichia coli TaxID=562 RepID=UPI00398B4A61